MLASSSTWRHLFSATRSRRRSVSKRPASTLRLSQLARIPPPSALVRLFRRGLECVAMLSFAAFAMRGGVRSADVLAFRARCTLTVDVTPRSRSAERRFSTCAGRGSACARQKRRRSDGGCANACSRSRGYRGPHLVLATAPREVWHSIGDFLRARLAVASSSDTTLQGTSAIKRRAQCGAASACVTPPSNASAPVLVEGADPHQVRALHGFVSGTHRPRCNVPRPHRIVRRCPQVASCRQ